MLATCLIPPRPEFALKEEVNLYLGQLPMKKIMLVIAKGLTNALILTARKTLTVMS